MKILTKGIFLGIAAIIQGSAMAIFLFPHFIPTGGAAGFAVLINFIFGVPFEITLWILNATLLFAAIKWLGKWTAIWTLYCVTVTSVIIGIMTPFVTEPLSNVVIDLGIGSLIFGVGIGILFRLGASSGGMDILALIISKTKGYNPGKTLFYINGSILLLTGIVVDWRIIFFAVIAQFMSTRILDMICKVRVKQYKASMRVDS